MKTIIAMTSILLASSASLAQTMSFDKDHAGAPPSGWICGVTGRGNPRWTVEPETSAPSAANVLMQSGTGDFPWCLRAGSELVDGFVQVKFKSISGRRDQAGGLIWRWKDSNNYYVARANALENNVSLYYTEGGTRKTLKYVDVPVTANDWHLLRVEFENSHIVVLLDAKKVIEFDDEHISGAGPVGVWTKADSVTAFDDFSFGTHTDP